MINSKRSVTKIENRDAATTLALLALGWVLSEEDRALRLLSLTGLTPEQLRNGASSPSILAAVIAFLEAYEPDLFACAVAIGYAPEQIVHARNMLES